MYIIYYKDRVFFKEEHGWSYSESMEDADIFLNEWEVYSALYNIRKHYPIFSPKIKIKQIRLVDFHDEHVDAVFRRMSSLVESSSYDELQALRSIIL